jgi:hypothetical protein
MWQSEECQTLTAISKNESWEGRAHRQGTFRIIKAATMEIRPKVSEFLGSLLAKCIFKKLRVGQLCPSIFLREIRAICRR